MTNFTERIVLPALVAAVIAACGPAAAATLPIESERENQEFLLDLWTNQYDRYWREAWDGGDNRFRFRLGSNNVREWFIEEELKFAATLGGRFRFLFHHSRLIRDSSDQQEHDVLEFEGRLHETWYLSVLIEAAFEKAENSLGFMIQNRRAVNKYTRFYVEFPHLVRNFAERHGDTGGKTLTVFTDKPIRIGIDVRELLANNVWLRLAGYTVPDFRAALEDGSTGDIFTGENGYADELEGWIEYFRSSRGNRYGETAAGLNFGYEKNKKGGPGKNGRFLPALNAPAKSLSRPGLITGSMDRDFYTTIDPDTISGWEQKRMYMGPYVWVPLNDSYIMKGSLTYTDRSLEWYDESGRKTKVDNTALAAGVGVQKRIGDGGTYVEAGFASEYRHRVEKRSGAGVTPERREDDFEDRRVYLAYERRFGRNRAIRLIETIDLDKEDWGAFSIHDHAFVQLLFDF